jgi:hypothetical protein
MDTALTRHSSAPRQHFVIPVPGENGAQPGALAGKTFVLTGVFPEVGGGAGLSLGKGKVKAMIESFGGRVTGSISGKTHVLVVGKNPGTSKVSAARSRSNVQLVNLKDLKEVGIEAGRLEDAKPIVIRSFSTGYRSNGKSLLASEADLTFAAGDEPPRRVRKTAKKRPALLDSKPSTRRRPTLLEPIYQLRRGKL